MAPQILTRGMAAVPAGAYAGGGFSRPFQARG
jgi:hypothetical protein